MTELEPQFLEVVSTSAQEMRTAFAALQPGVIDSGDLKVSASGVGRSVDVAAGAAVVKGVFVADQGLYRVRNDATKNSAAFTTGGIAANATGQPRIDQVIARVFDTTADGSGARLWRLEVITGTGTAGATLDNRTGATADATITAVGGSGWLRLADVLVPNGAVSILAANVRDRRPWARGAFGATSRSAGDLSTASTTNVEMLTSAERIPLEIGASGIVRLELGGNITINTNSAGATITPRIDGTDYTGYSRFFNPDGVNSLAYKGFGISWTFFVGAGYHLFSFNWRTSAGTVTMPASASVYMTFSVAECYPPNALNT